MIILLVLLSWAKADPSPDLDFCVTRLESCKGLRSQFEPGERISVIYRSAAGDLRKIAGRPERDLPYARCTGCYQRAVLKGNALSVQAGADDRYYLSLTMRNAGGTGEAALTAAGSLCRELFRDEEAIARYRDDAFADLK